MQQSAHGGSTTATDEAKARKGSYDINSIVSKPCEIWRFLGDTVTWGASNTQSGSEWQLCLISWCVLSNQGS